jgi:hypothetical protein
VLHIFLPVDAAVPSLVYIKHAYNFCKIKDDIIIMIHYTSLHHKNIYSTHTVNPSQVAMCLDMPYCIILIYLTPENFTSQGESAIIHDLFLPRPLIQASKLNVMFQYSAMQLLHS